MQELTESALRGAFVNCSKGEASRLPLPSGYAEVEWETQVYLGWADARNPGRAYLLTPHDGRFVGVVLRRNQQPGGSPSSSMCAFCYTVHPGSGVALMAAARPGESGRRGNSMGTYLCADLGCSDYVNGVRSPAPTLVARETLNVDQRRERARAKVRSFVNRLLEPQVAESSLPV